MGKARNVKKVLEGAFTRDGAGVKLRRIFGYHQVPLFDPFLLLDEFRSANPDDYVAGFPWHPHRGIETVTYMIRGKVEHGDSLGNKGVISDGDCQWMTAGSGIIHTEMPQKSDMMWGYQLWVNLPAGEKMTAPRYRDIRANDIPAVHLDGTGMVKVICGSYGSMEGPVKGISANPIFLDVELNSNREFIYPTDPEYNVFIYIIDGNGLVGPEDKDSFNKGSIVLFDKGEEMVIKSGLEGLRFLLVSGRPLREPVAWGGPIVMNTQQELDIAFEEYEKGTFIK